MFDILPKKTAALNIFEDCLFLFVIGFVVSSIS